MSEIPPPAWSAPELGGISGRDGPMDGMPQRFGKYTLIRKLASGGMAELFLAIHRSVAGFEKLIVIKRILPAMNQDRQFIDMLLHEARVAATLSHPNIVQIFDVGQIDGIYYIAMEHVHGEDLRSIVRQMKKRGMTEFPIEHALAIILGTCSGLAYAHEKRELDGSPLNIVHRDISPQNIVVTFTGDVKIVDFGIAKSDTKTTQETKSGKLKGKIPYMSPEQARGDRIDWRSDIFSTAVLLFELTTGKRLFKGQSEYETLKLICEREYPTPSQVSPGYSPELENIVMRGLAKAADQRFQTAREMQGAVEEFVRRNQLKVSQIALQHFMQDLFADKLASQKEALLHGKQLADIIEMQRAADSSQEFEASGHVRTLSAPAAARTVTNVDANRRKSGAGWLVALGVVLVLLAAAGGTAAYVVKQRAAAMASAAAAAATQTTAPPVARGSIEVTSDPPGAAIWINGDLRPEVTPATVAQLPTGQNLDVKLTRDGFEQVKQSVELSEAQPTKKIDVKLVKGSVSLAVTVKPAGIPASMTLDGKPFDGNLDGLSSGVEHKVVVTAPGYREQQLAFIGNAMEKKQLDVTLDKLPNVPHVATAKTTATQPTATANTAPAGNGKLNVSASGGWCNISVDGAGKGPTPVAGIELGAGPHKVVCTPDGKPPIAATVTVTADGVTRHKFTIP